MLNKNYNQETGVIKCKWDFLRIFGRKLVNSCVEDFEGG